MSAPVAMTQEQIAKMFDLTGKVAIITGGAGFLGHAAARGLAAHGADIVVTSRSIGSLEAVATEIQGLGRKALDRYLQLTHPPNPLGKTLAATLKEST